MPVSQADIDAARAKYLSLIKGESAEEFVDQNGERVKFTRGDAAALLAWINANDPGLNAPGANPFQPIRFLF